MSRFIQLSDAQSGMAVVLSINRRRLHMVDFPHRVLLHCPRGAAHGLGFSSVKATRPPSVAQFVTARADP